MKAADKLSTKNDAYHAKEYGLNEVDKRFNDPYQAKMADLPMEASNQNMTT